MLETKIKQSITKFYTTEEEFKKDYSVLKVKFHPVIKERTFDLKGNYEGVFVEYIKKKIIN